jgi:hypothetical protein
MCGQMSGPLRFLHFAGVCAEKRFLDGLIGKDDLEKIKWHLENKVKPEIEFLKRCFPNAASKITDWSSASVADYWHNHHGHTGDCAVKVATVISVINATGNVLLLCDGQHLYKPNIFKLDLKKGDEVYLHGLIPIEKK